MAPPPSRGHEERAAPTGEGAARPGSRSLPQPADNEELTISQRFDRFDGQNPHVYDLLVRLARLWVKRTGRDRIGIAALFERARWELSLSTTETAPTLNNDYRAYYARKIMAQEPDLAELFETRRSTADKDFGIVRWPGADGPRLGRGPGAS